jgi:hypothetical protein
LLVNYINSLLFVLNYCSEYLSVNTFQGEK